MATEMKCDPDDTIELTPLQVEVLLLSATQDAERYEREHGLKQPHKTPTTFPKMAAVVVGIAALVTACGGLAPEHNGPQYVCYPIDGGSDAGEPAPAQDAGDYCQSKAPPGCVLRDLATGADPGGDSLWCCADVAAGKLFCCAGSK